MSGGPLGGDGGLNLPYESNPPGQTIPLDDALITSATVVMAAVVPLANGHQAAGLVMRQAKARRG